MTPRSAFATGWASDKGNVREANEDACFVAPDVGLWAVADGMGGHSDGRMASDTVVAALRGVERVDSASDLRDRCEAAILAANAQLRSVSASRGGDVLGSTVVVLLVFDRFFACLWAGDSRMHLVRGGQISQLTRDHTEVEDLIAKGVMTREEASRWPRRNVITRAIGVVADPQLDMSSGEVLEGDTFVLCSDGLTGHVSADEIAAIAASMPPQEACDRLIAITLARGATDNVTVVVVRREKDGGTVVAPGARPARWGQVARE